MHYKERLFLPIISISILNTQGKQKILRDSVIIILKSKRPQKKRKRQNYALIQKNDNLRLIALLFKIEPNLAYIQLKQFRTPSD